MYKIKRFMELYELQLYTMYFQLSICKVFLRGISSLGHASNNKCEARQYA